MYLFRTLHPMPIVLKPDRPSLPPAMLHTLLFSFAAFFLLFVALLRARYRLAVERDLLAEREGHSSDGSADDGRHRGYYHAAYIVARSALRAVHRQPRRRVAARCGRASRALERQRRARWRPCRRAHDGIVYLVGAGPGDPGLLTVRGRELLARCDAIATDALANPALVAAARARNPAVELHDVGKRGGSGESARQDDDQRAARPARGARASASCGSRVAIRSSSGAGARRRRRWPRPAFAFELVPGVTAGIAAPAYAGIPVTHRGVATSVTFVTGHEDPAKPETQTDWAALARAGGTIVLYMGVKTLPRIAAALMAGGMSLDTPAAAVQWGTHARQRTVTATVATLADAIARAGLGAPVITVIGAVVALRDEIAWFDQRPLFGARIVVTRASAQATRAPRRARGARRARCSSCRRCASSRSTRRRSRARSRG